MKKKIGAMFLAMCMLLGMLSGCGSKQPSAQASTSAKESLTSSALAEETPAQQDTAPAPETSASEAEPASAQEPDYSPVSYPLCEPGEITLDVYMAMSGFLPMVILNLALGIVQVNLCQTEENPWSSILNVLLVCVVIGIQERRQ